VDRHKGHADSMLDSVSRISVSYKLFCWLQQLLLLLVQLITPTGL